MKLPDKWNYPSVPRPPYSEKLAQSLKKLSSTSPDRPITLIIPKVEYGPEGASLPFGPVPDFVVSIAI
jgi:hypothetical protein